MISSGKFWIGIGLSFAFLALFFWTVDVKEMAGSLAGANYVFLAPAIAAYLVSVLFGVGYGGISLCYPVIVRQYSPAASAGRRLGIVLLFGASGMALGGWLAGYVFDLSGSYAPAFLIGVAFNIANLIILMFLIVRGRGRRQLPATA